MKPQRNQPCPCGSGKKYKHCCHLSQPPMKPAASRDSLLAQASAAFSRGDLQSALAAARAVLNSSPDDADAHHVWGLVLYQQNDLTGARVHLEKAARRAPRNAFVHSNLGRVLDLLAEHDTAERHCRLALELNPAQSDAHNNLGNILKNIGRHDQALYHYREAVRLSPAVVSYRCNLGTLLMERGETEEAQSHFERVIEQDPSFSAAFANLGALHLQQGRLEAARSALEDALKRRPDYAHALANLGLVWHRLGEFRQAVDCYHRAMEMDPEIRHTYSSNLITVLEDAGDLDAAHEAAVEVLEHAAERRMALSAAIKNFGKTCDFARRERAERLWHRHVLEGRLPVDMLLGCNYTNGFSPEELLVLHRRWAEAVGYLDRDDISVSPAKSRPSSRRLRIGYLSPDFRKHATAYFVEPILAHHDRESFEIYGYHNHGKEDEMTDKVRERCDQFLSTPRLSDDELHSRIRSDEIDILVDLAGHTHGSRLKMMARRAAPIQATYLGYPNTTGLRAVDYIIVDRYIAQTGMAYCTEIPAVLPECLVTFQPLPVAPGDVSPPCVQAGHVTFGSLNNLMKITAEVVACWAEILAQTTGSKLLIGYVGADAGCTRDNLERVFMRHGIGADRLILVGRLAREEFLGLYRRIDIFLDTFPYTGTTTTCEALLMNVPVVTRTGTAQRERVSASVLSHVGLSQLLASDAESYVTTSVSLARNVNELAALRRSIPALLSGSVLSQPQRLARGLERLYREMWGRYVRQDRKREPLTI
jgi:predicted O-linked N-acetylglucosamine transferase (SPINDLY family)